MSDGKLFLLVSGMAAVIVLFIAALIHVGKSVDDMPVQRSEVTYSAAVSRPEQQSHTFAFMPGQYADIPNRRFRKIEIHSTFPIRVVSGPCETSYGVEFFCDSEPTDIFITDMRPNPIFSTPQGNLITITATEF